ncbi:MAG: SUMF1/EgtB/PvdO family nonheme iron enzyme [Chloroflexi bacterium]|nr:SUMF1/EgtB/PvdO family nonheme iron enzyme [Chloroflexota bacterium]
MLGRVGDRPSTVVLLCAIALLLAACLGGGPEPAAAAPTPAARPAAEPAQLPQPAAPASQPPAAVTSGAVPAPAATAARSAGPPRQAPAQPPAFPGGPAVAVRSVHIAAGAFTMGRDDGPADERPAHSVQLAALKIDVLPVTTTEFAAFLNVVGPANRRGQNLFDVEDPDARIHRVDGRFRPDPGFDRHPVVEASWFGARDYCAWRGARLPSEAEWERAARGPEGRPYPWGDAAPDTTRARFGARMNDYLPVGSIAAGSTPDGILDLAGNVWQWLSSLYRPYPYRADDGREDGDSRDERVTRGGGHGSPAAHLRASYRGRGLSRAPSAGHHNIGFRCARGP